MNRPNARLALLREGFAHLGLKGIRGRVHNPEIIRITESAGFKWLSDLHGDDYAWCSVFMNYLAKETGLQRSRRAAARSWLAVGEDISSEEVMPGDVAVFWRGKANGSLGHVGIYLGDTGDKVHVLGGNQGNAVTVAQYPYERLLGFRRLGYERQGE